MNEADEPDADAEDDADDEAADPVDADLAARLGALWETYRGDDAAGAVRLGRELVRQHPSNGEAWFWLGCSLEREGAYQAADRCFVRAAKAAQDAQGMPFRVSWRQFQQAVSAAGDALPAPLRAALEEVTLVLADYAEPALLEGFDEPEILGLFVGNERGDREEPGTPQISARIHLFRRAHEHACSTRHEFTEEIRQTLWHELGHYLGYDEGELEELGRG